MTKVRIVKKEPLLDLNEQLAAIRTHPKVVSAGVYKEQFRDKDKKEIALYIADEDLSQASWLVVTTKHLDCVVTHGDYEMEKFSLGSFTLGLRIDRQLEHHYQQHSIVAFNSQPIVTGGVAFHHPHIRTTLGGGTTLEAYAEGRVGCLVCIAGSEDNRYYREAKRSFNSKSYVPMVDYLIAYLQKADHPAAFNIRSRIISTREEFEEGGGVWEPPEESHYAGISAAAVEQFATYGRTVERYAEWENNYLDRESVEL